MKRHLSIAVLLLAVGVAAPTVAQTRVDQQVFLDIRLLQSQVSKLQLAVNALVEQLAKTDGRLDAASAEAVKGFANQKLLIESLSTQIRTLTERETETSGRSLQAIQEIKTLREALDAQQKQLNEIISLLTRPGGVVDPTAAATGQPAAPPAGGALPPSPTAYYESAMRFFYDGKWESAVLALQDALKKYPDAVQAARAHLTIGESLEGMGGRNQEALNVYQTVIQKYKDPDVVPDAYLKMGLLYEKMGQKDQAIKILKQIRTLFPSSTTADLAASNLKRMGG